MRRRKLRLPVLTVRTLLLVCGALVVVRVGVGLAMRASLTDYAHDGAAVEQLPFVVNSRASTDALSLHTREEIAAAADEAALPAEVDAAYTLGMASEEVLDEAPIVLTGTFTGERTYVYQAFQCQIEVTSVLRGEGVSEGDGLVVYARLGGVEGDGHGRLGAFRPGGRHGQQHRSRHQERSQFLKHV